MENRDFVFFGPKLCDFNILSLILQITLIFNPM